MEYIEGTSSRIENDLYDIMDGREQLDKHFLDVNDLWKSLTTFSHGRKDSCAGLSQERSSMK